MSDVAQSSAATAVLEPPQAGDGPPADPLRAGDDTVARIQAAFRKTPAKMTPQLARELGVTEVEVIAALPDGRSVELDAARREELIRAFEGFGTVHVIVSTDALTMECFGQFGNFSTWREFFNVQTKSLDLHIRPAMLHRVFAVEKPGHMDGVSTLSFQFFKPDGHSAFKVFLTFGGKEAPPEKAALFAELRTRFARPGR